MQESSADVVGAAHIFTVLPLRSMFCWRLPDFNQTPGRNAARVQKERRLTGLRRVFCITLQKRRMTPGSKKKHPGSTGIQYSFSGAEMPMGRPLRRASSRRTGSTQKAFSCTKLSTSNSSTSTGRA